jgi:hypothetical protein
LLIPNGLFGDTKRWFAHAGRRAFSCLFNIGGNSIVAWAIGLGRIRIIGSENSLKFIVLPHVGWKSGLHVLGHPAPKTLSKAFF